MNLVTGSSGFIGSRLIQRLSADGQRTRRLVRRFSGIEDQVVGDLDDLAAMREACAGVLTVFHCAGYAHAYSSVGEDSRRHWQINFEGTRNLLEAAGESGVRRFVFLSTVKAMADPGDICANECFPGDPQTAYGQSKLAAEQEVIDAGRRYGMHVVNLRLAMVYGSGGRGNLERMGRLIKMGIFPPLPETGNRRSLVHVDDVISAICRGADDDRANGRTYIVASYEAPSGRQLFDALLMALGLPQCSWAVPEPLFRFAGRTGDVLERVFGRRAPLDGEVVSRLLDSACYSPALIEKELGWQAQIPLVDGLKEMLGV